MALWGMRWGSSIMAFGADCNANTTIRVAALRFTIEETRKVTLQKGYVQNMISGELRSDLNISQIFGIS